MPLYWGRKRLTPDEFVRFFADLNPSLSISRTTLDIYKQER